MEEKIYKNFFKKFIILSGTFLIIIAALVIIIDPFFHYHGPILGLKRIQTMKEYQVNGILLNTEYNAILAGSSVTANINSVCLAQT